MADGVSILDQIRSCGLEPTNQVGQGAFGSVFSVKDIGGSVFALKYIREPKYEKIGFQGLLELDILRRFEHPHIIHSPLILTPARCGLRDALAIVMPLADTTLQNIVTNKFFTTETRLRILYKLCTALAFMHRHNVLHLDIKTTNIVTRGGEPYLIDFGLAMMVEDVQVGRSYPYELVTASNRPPEIFRGDRQYNGAVDVWSMGIVVLWLLSGQSKIFPADTNWYNNKSMLDEIDMLIERIPVLLGGVRDKYRQGCLSLIAGMLELDPKKRLTAQQVVDHPVFDDVRDIIVGNIAVKHYEPDYAADHRNILKIMLVWARDVFGDNLAQSLFLAIDIYNRLGSFYKDKDSTERMTMAAVSLLVAMKLLDEFYEELPKYQRLLNKLVPSITVDGLLDVEAEAIDYLGGVLYHSPFFDKLRTGDELRLTFDNIIMDRDSSLYLRVDTDAWARIARELATTTKYPTKDITINALLS
jgi:serine/threonine protein kinase